LNFTYSISNKVFPHDDSAVVCGLEVFVGGKHIVAKVKEKETAHKEYREAVEKGHGAYLMDQGNNLLFFLFLFYLFVYKLCFFLQFIHLNLLVEIDDRLSISIGNLPPKTDVFLKVTYISELV
jgi:poly [ADP-ribose] polymerase